MSDALIPPAACIGAVAIGRNEGERLRRCLQSLRNLGHTVVYVDSGSTDHSAALAAALDCDVVILDPSRPFTAAAARNAGFSRLIEIAPGCEFVQFVDGDCEVVDGWIASASAFLTQNQDYAVACGRRRERYPENSLYNQVCDFEWNTPVGEVEACGGDALMRVDVVRGIGGFDAALIAGEEPELCSRLRKAGWRIMRLDVEMTLHDANITHLSQWWRRTMRARLGLRQRCRHGSQNQESPLGSGGGASRGCGALPCRLFRLHSSGFSDLGGSCRSWPIRSSWDEPQPLRTGVVDPSRPPSLTGRSL